MYFKVSSVSAKSQLTVLAIVTQLLLLQLDVCSADKSKEKESKEAKAGGKNSIDQFLNMRYELVDSQNFDEIMKSLGVGWWTRQLGALAKPIMELKKNGDQYILTSESSFKNTVTKFKLGQEFDEETPDGRNVKSVLTADGNKLYQTQKGAKTTEMVREFSPEQVKLTVKVGDIASTRIYKRVQGK